MRAILTYHSIDESASPISVSERVFRRQVEWLARGGVQVATLDALMRLPVDADAVALTFDDAFANFGEIAAPLLIEHRIPATVFVVSDAAGGTNRWPAGADRGVPELSLLDWNALGRLSTQGIELGSHTRTHANLARVPLALLEDEIAGGAGRMHAETGVTPSAFAYPYGGVTDQAADLVGRHFAWGCTTAMRLLSPHDRAATLPRIDMFYFREPGQLESWGTARFRCRLGIRAGARLVRGQLRSMMGAA
jgi:peptidoglycan/xylan/chitin deacetylase (PgdA/CDA1 family)